MVRYLYSEHGITGRFTCLSILLTSCSMKLFYGIGLLAACCAASTAAAAVPGLPGGVIIDERFDQYPDQAAFEAVWLPSPSSSPAAPPEYGGKLLPDNFDVVPPVGIDGKAIHAQNGINSYAGDALPELYSLQPTFFEPIRLSADIFSDETRNKRASVGIRSTSGPPGSLANVVELGHWNAPVTDPTIPTGQPPVTTYSETSFAYRLIMFGPLAGDLVQQPNFQYFPLDPQLDRPDDGDAIVTHADIGPGWHRYTATIGVDFVTLTLDLFRDGINNATGAPGVDSEVTHLISARNSPFNDLRIGGVSGLMSIQPVVIDNVRLERVAIPEPTAAALLLTAAGLLYATRRRRA